MTAVLLIVLACILVSCASRFFSNYMYYTYSVYFVILKTKTTDKSFTV